MPPYEDEVVVWKENYFMRTVNINEPRGPKYNCTECGEVFNTRLSILTHSKMHMKPFCVVCGLYTEDVQKMQQHMKCKHRSMVNIIPAKDPLDINQNITDHSVIEKEELVPNKKQKGLTPKRVPFGFNGQSKNDKQLTKCLVSRFGRCINVKMPEF